MAKTRNPDKKAASLVLALLKTVSKINRSKNRDVGLADAADRLAAQIQQNSLASSNTKPNS